MHVAAIVAYLEAANEVVSGEQLVEYEFEGVIPAGLVQSKHIKRPLVDVLRAEGRIQINARTRAHTVLSVLLHGHACGSVNTLSTDMTVGG